MEMKKHYNVRQNSPKTFIYEYELVDFNYGVLTVMTKIYILGKGHEVNIDGTIRV